MNEGKILDINTVLFQPVTICFSTGAIEYTCKFFSEFEVGCQNRTFVGGGIHVMCACKSDLCNREDVFHNFIQESHAWPTEFFAELVFNQKSSIQTTRQIATTERLSTTTNLASKSSFLAKGMTSIVFTTRILNVVLCNKL